MLLRRWRHHRAGDLLRVCPVCGRGLVCPTAWEPSDDAHWHIDLRCADCEHEWEAVIEDARAHRYDYELDIDIALIHSALRRLDLERMGFEVEVFSEALSRDLIGPADFA